MVSYETWVSVVRSVADQKGADVSDFEMNSMIVSAAADLWRENKPQLKAMTRPEAQTFATNNVQVNGR